MDPDANMREQVELAAEIITRVSAPDGGDGGAEWLLTHAERLAELVVALDEWLEKGGFPPHAPKLDGAMTYAQAISLARRVRPKTAYFTVRVGPFGLPDGYLLVEFDDGFTCGISPEGDVSS